MLGLVLLLALAVPACSGSEKAGSSANGQSNEDSNKDNDNEDVVPVDGVCDETDYSSGTDTDEDGLSDACEKDLFGTSHMVADTDGDGLSDYVEIVERGYDPALNNYLYNPLIADIPQIDIDITSAPDLSLQLSFTDTTSTTVSTTDERSASSSQTVESSNTNSNSFSIEESHHVGVELSQSLSYGSDGVGGETSVSASYDYTNTTTNEQSVSWTDTQATENSNTLSTAETAESGKTLEQSASAGFVSVTVKVQNNAERSFTVTNMLLTATMLDPISGEVAYPIGNLQLDSSYSSFPTFSLASGEETGNINYTSGELSVDLVKDLMANSTGLNIGVALYEIEDINGVSFAFARENVNAKTAAVIVDPGLYGDRKIRRYRVSTVANPANKTLTAKQLLSDILKLDYTRKNDGSLKQITLGGSNLGTDIARFWTVIHQSKDSQGNSVLNVYNPVTQAYDFEAITIKAGDTIHLSYMNDEDGDSLGMRQEFAFGTSGSNPDSDGDGITDGQEVYVFGTHPNKADTDGDGTSDLAERFVEVSQGGNHGLGIAADGSLWAWGGNGYGQLGLGDTTNRGVPTKVGTDTDWEKVYAATFASLAIKKDGTLWAWGSNPNGELGLGAAYNFGGTTCNSEDCVMSPVQVGVATNWKDISATKAILALKDNGTLWSWGDNYYGQLGQGTSGTGTDVFEPTQVGTATNWIEVSSGDNVSLARKANNTIWGAGSNTYGALGQGDTTLRNTFTKIGLDNDWKTIAAGGQHALAIKNDGTLWSWGRNDGGALGLGSTSGPETCGFFACATTPQQVGSSQNWRALAAGGGVSFAISNDNLLFSWGTNYNGVLGQNLPASAATTVDTPTAVNSDTDWATVFTAGNAVVAQKYGYTRTTWGWDIYGSLGLNTTVESDRLVPVVTD